MTSYRLLNYNLGSTFDCYIVKAKALFFFKVLGNVLVLRIPSFCFFKVQIQGLSLAFQKAFFFKNFLWQFFFRLQQPYFFLRLKVRGLGYRIKSLTPIFFRFFIGTTNLYFFHAPSDMYVRVRRRRMLLVSRNVELLHLVFSHLLLLKKIIPYKLRGVFYPKQLILLKPGKKSF